jgi:hypothetical protein
MSHFAQISNGTVVQVIVSEQDFINTLPGQWIQTSYNTRGNVHYAPNGGAPDGGVALRGNYAGIGFTYDATHDVFYPPSPYPSWTINTSTWSWQAPVAYPTDGKIYTWSESTKSWISES